MTNIVQQEELEDDNKEIMFFSEETDCLQIFTFESHFTFMKLNYAKCVPGILFICAFNQKKLWL